MRRNVFGCTVILILALATTVIRLSAQTVHAKKADSTTIQKNNSRMTCQINGKKVSQRAFKKFLSSLEEIEGTWMCLKTKEGGITRYHAKDQNGIVYQYEARQEEVKNGSQRDEQSLLIVRELNLR